LDGEGGIVDATIFEKVLFGFLDFDDEAIAACSLAINVEDGFAINGCADSKMKCNTLIKTA
jgi:GH15 family glucan-1,4-alpha-glucosidase